MLYAGLRLDHRGNFVTHTTGLGAAPLTYAPVCRKHIGVHHVYLEEMAVLWEAVKDEPRQHSPAGNEAVRLQYFRT